MRAVAAMFLTVTALVMMSVPALAHEEVTVIPDALFCGGLADGDTADCESVLGSLAEAGVVPESYAGLLSAPAGEGGSSATESGTVREVIVHEGGGYANTAPFQLSGGDYVAAIDTGGCSDFSFATLMPTDGYPRGIVDTEGDGRSHSYGVEAGRYYWSVTGGCDRWTVTLTPFTG